MKRFVILLTLLLSVPVFGQHGIIAVSDSLEVVNSMIEQYKKWFESWNKIYYYIALTEGIVNKEEKFKQILEKIEKDLRKKEIRKGDGFWGLNHQMQFYKRGGMNLEIMIECFTEWMSLVKEALEDFKKHAKRDYENNSRTNK